ncbi:MAG TPA: MBL fold metallo-hydrolase [Vicinamibacterales bacterium]|jgi:glyoxylase-like metal-dependent hydrolase (beta-lactamase superfamily II)|nr:MBL fold metallo-hydrolase [Vicinamibacterales bacterium]
MRETWWTPVAIAAVLSMGACTGPRATLKAAARAMGANDLRSIEYSGSGTTYGYQQSGTPGGPWPRFDTRTYIVGIDYTKPAMRVEQTRSQGEHPPAGGAGQPMAGETRQIQLVNGRHAWNQVGVNATPAMGAVSERLRQLWKTPHGIVKAALANPATEVNGKEFTFEIEGEKVTATLNSDNLVERVTTVVDSPVLGDTPIVITYSDYVDRGGVKFPSHIVETTDEFPTLDIRITDVTPNAGLALDVPANVQQAQAPPPPDPARLPTVQAEKIAEGVWYLDASNYHSIAVEFKDHIVMFEAPISEQRTIAIHEWVRKTIPDKPINYVVNTHHHFDHSGGLRAYVAEGIPIITHEGNKAYYQKVWARPRTINPDRLARSPKEAVFETMTDRKVLTDGTRRLELHLVEGNGHTPYVILGYLPKERIVMYGDMYNPLPGDDPRDLARTNEFAINLHENMEKLNPKPVTLAPIHGRVVPYTNLKKAIGAIPLT